MHDREFKLHRSIYYTAGVFVLLIISAVIVLNLTLSWWYKILLLSVLLGYGRYIVRYPVLGTLRYVQNRQWLLQVANTAYLATVCGDSTLTRCLLVLRLHVSGERRPRTWIILRDSLPADDYRRLVVRLRTE